MNITTNLIEKFSVAPLTTFVSCLIGLSVTTVFGAIFIDFQIFNKKYSAITKRSKVATNTMVLFFIFYYIVIALKIWSVKTVWWVQIIGTLMIVSGAVINVTSRIMLGGNWANHIKIYDSHTLVTSGMYKFMRHPLYSSIMLMLFGGSVVYGNLTSGILTALFFIPMMNYRAKQEEKLLIEKFPEYKNYMKKVRRFI